MRRRILLTLVIVCIVFVAGALLWNRPLRPAIASGHPAWPPIMFQDNQAIDGAGAALLTKIFTGLDLRVNVTYAGAWDEVQAKAKSGDVDLIVAAYKTAEREMYMDYSIPYTTDPVAVFVKKGVTFRFDTWDDLKQKRGLATVGDSYGQAFDDYEKANLELTRVAMPMDAFDALTEGTADYFIYSLYAGEDIMKQKQTTGQFVALPTYVAEEPFYVTVAKKSPYAKYLPQINAALEKYKADGTIDRLIAEYRMNK